MAARFSSSKNKNAWIILRAGMETHPIMILLHSIYSPAQVRSLPRFKEWRNRLHPLIGVSTNNCGYFYNFPCTGYLYMENIPRTSVGNEDGNTIRMGISLKKRAGLLRREEYCTHWLIKMRLASCQASQLCLGWKCKFMGKKKRSKNSGWGLAFQES